MPRVLFRMTNSCRPAHAIITDLPNLVAALPPAKRARFERIFRVDVAVGEIRIPDSMRAWTEAQLGPIEGVERQSVVRVTNTVTWDGALFNPLRGKRPMRHATTSNVKRKEPSDDIFAEPLRTTAEDMFGRVRGKHCVTAGNISRWEGQSAVLIFDEYDPLKFNREQLRDYIATTWEWAQRAHAHDPEARYFVWGWNGGLKAGASIPHGHAQMALGRGMHYARIEWLRRAALDYRARYGTNYFADLQAAHDDVGLGITAGKLRGFIYLAPTCLKETWLMGRAFDDELADALHDALRALIDRTGTDAFNVFVTLPPSPSPFEGEGRGEGVPTNNENWSGFPLLMRIGDRGPASMVSSDIGWIDLYAHNVISTDPFVVKVLTEL